MENLLAIHLIEAPNEDDLYENRLEKNLIKPIAQFCGISFTPHIVLNRKNFCKALDEIKSDGHIPILHFAGHGNQKGIGLPDRDLITWTDLRNLLIPVNTRVHNILFVCMSCCKGFTAVKAAMSLETYNPYLAIIGTAGSPTIAQTSVAFATFYHQLTLFSQLLSGQQLDNGINSLDDIIKNMREASLHREWYWLESKRIRDIFTKARLRSILQLDS